MTPADDLHETVHAQRVMERLRAAIRAAGGWLPFDEYMSLALYAPGLGYYSAGARKLGAGGDFTTAPEISPLFGRCLARHCAQVLGELGGGDVLEVGAGSGRLAFDLLHALHAAGRLPARYRILEISADLRERQRALLATLPAQAASRVDWLDAPPAEQWQGALLANEVLDALPVECFEWHAGAPLERGVALDDAGALLWQSRPAAPSLRAEILRLHAGLAGTSEGAAPWREGYTSELCTRAGPWIAEMTRSLASGVALFIDYGLPRREYYHPERSAGTLRCHHRQRAHDDPFAHPGMEDITAWVDFTRVAEAADAARLEVLGFATQAALLLGLGIEAEIMAAPDETTRIRRASEARQLLMPSEMGERFKAIALGRDFGAPLIGFAHQDLRRSL
ncbi:MAG TPA: SAM-dependent methyltransferase [Steroidobacteraceae bacterium]|nr:SAM-dependent methyltransferase [Steroidobacteraceae bacterium]